MSDESEVFLRATAELAGLEDRGVMIAFDMDPMSVFTTVALLQFAWRNPRLDDYQRTRLEMLAKGLTAGLKHAGAPTCADVLEEGWDTSKDVPISPPAPRSA